MTPWISTYKDSIRHTTLSQNYIEKYVWQLSPCKHTKAFPNSCWIWRRLWSVASQPNTLDENSLVRGKFLDTYVWYHGYSFLYRPRITGMKLPLAIKQPKRKKPDMETQWKNNTSNMKPPNNYGTHSGSLNLLQVKKNTDVFHKFHIINVEYLFVIVGLPPHRKKNSRKNLIIWGKINLFLFFFLKFFSKTPPLSWESRTIVTRRLSH